MSTRGGTKKDLLAVISGLQAKVAELPSEKPDALIWRRKDVEEVIAEAESAAKRTKRTHYVGAIGWPEGSQIYGEGTLGITDDKELISGLGTIFATCEPDKTTRHL